MDGLMFFFILSICSPVCSYLYIRVVDLSVIAVVCFVSCYRSCID